MKLIEALDQAEKEHKAIHLNNGNPLTEHIIYLPTDPILRIDVEYAEHCTWVPRMDELKSEDWELY